MRLLAALLIAACPLACHAGGWQDRLPQRWLVALAVEDLGRLEQKLGDLLPPWGIRLAGVSERLETLLPGAPLGDDAWVIGLAEADDLAVEPFLLLPTQDFDALCDAIQADRADNVAITRIAGYDLVLAAHGSWAWVTPLRAAMPAPMGAPDEPIAAERPNDSDTSLHLSHRGLQLLAQRLSDQEPPNRRLPRRFAMPVDVSSLIRALAPYGPIVSELVQQRASVSLSLGADAESGDLLAGLTLRTDQASQDNHKSNASSSILASESIATLKAAALPPALIHLGAAWVQSSPDDVEAQQYEPNSFESYKEALRQLLTGMTEVRHRLVLPGEDSPLMANHLVKFQWNGAPDQLGEHLSEACIRWNEVVRKSGAKSELFAEFSPLAAEASPTEQAGYRVSFDLVTALGANTPEARDLFARLYGEGGRLTALVAPLGEGEWVYSTVPAADLKPLLDAAQAEASNAPGDAKATTPCLAAGQARLDRWISFQQRLDDLLYGDSLGRKVRPPMNDSPPAQLRVTSVETGYHLEARLPVDAFKTAAVWWGIQPSTAKPSR